MRWLSVVALLGACGPTLTGARDDAAQRSCAYFARCGELGAGKTYPDAAECLTKQRSFWTDGWPVQRCEAMLDASALDVCLRAIDATQCGNGLDLLATLSKCGSSQVCQ